MTTYRYGDTVEVVCKCAWTGEVGRVVGAVQSWSGGSYRVRLAAGVLEFPDYDLRPSQEKLDLEPA
jgi:hypothetical protein